MARRATSVGACGAVLGRALATALALLASLAQPTTADESWHQKTEATREPASEAWVGGEAFDRVWSLYAGSTYAPFGSLRQDGLRLRAISGSSSYRYSGRRYDPGIGNAVSVAFRGQAHFADVLVGYQASFGPTTVKIFAGIEIAGHLITPFDTETAVQGRARGAKAALEAWHDIGRSGWVALDLAMAQAHRAYSARLRGAVRIDPLIALGLEVQAVGHEEADIRRAGAFVRFDNERHELSVSAGWSMPRAGDAGAYGTTQWLTRF